MRYPPDADEYKTQNIGQEFRSQGQKGVRQRGRNVLVLQLWHMNFQHKKGNDDGEDPIAKSLDP